MSDARAAATGISGGLFLMTFFTLAWTANTPGAWPPAVAWAVVGVGVVAGVAFVAQGVRLIRAAGRVPATTQAGDPARAGDQAQAGDPARRPSGRAFGLVFGAEGLGIFLALIVLHAVGHSEFAVPVIALIVGLHFYPMARIFHRRVDLYIATWTCLVAIAGIVALAATDAATEQVAAAVAVGAAVATITYGVYLFRLAGQVIAGFPAPGTSTALS